MINFDFDVMGTVEGNINDERTEIQKDVIELYENEVLCYDIDDEIESELSMFHDKIKDIEMDKIGYTKNWFYVYKAMNYDIFENLKIERVYKFSRISVIVELNFAGSKEYDLITFIEEDKTVSVINVVVDKNGYLVKDRCVRRKLIPTTPEEALAYAKKDLNKEDVKAVQLTMNELEKNITKYHKNEKVTNILGVDFMNKNKEKVENGKTTNKADNKVKYNKAKEKVNVDVNKVEVKEEIKGIDLHYTKAIEYIRKGDIDSATNILTKYIYTDMPTEIRNIQVDSFIKSILIIKA